MLTYEYGDNYIIIQAHPFRNKAGILCHSAINRIELYNGTETSSTFLYSGIRLSGSAVHLPAHCCQNAVLIKD